MREADVKKIIKLNYEKLELNTQEVIVNSTRYNEIKNWKEISDALFSLLRFPFLIDSIESLFECGANVRSNANNITIISSSFKDFENKFKIVKAKCEAILDYNDSKNCMSKDNNLYVKLPDELDDLNELEEIIKSLEYIFNKCPILNESYKKIGFVGVEHGSSWLVLSIIVTSLKLLPGALNNIADFIKKCNEIRIQNRTIRKMDLDYYAALFDFTKEEFDEKIKIADKKIKEQQSEVCIEKFKEIEGIKKEKISPEDTLSITHAMVAMIDLIEKGVEIYSSDNVDDNVKTRFPAQEDFKKFRYQDVKLLDKEKEEK